MKILLKLFQKIKDFFLNYDEIVEIKEIGYNKVIDIEVSGNHLFYANELLTHNSGSGGGYAGEDISMNNTSDSSGINMDADAIFALYQLEGEREIGRLNIKILKNRLGGYVDRIFPMSVNYDTLKITDWNNDDQDGELDDQVFEEVNVQDNKKPSNNSSDDINKLFEGM